jgi:hypothetical protein
MHTALHGDVGEQRASPVLVAGDAGGEPIFLVMV